jgi:hypothetical protein
MLIHKNKNIKKYGLFASQMVQKEKNQCAITNGVRVNQVEGEFDVFQ